MKVLIAVAEDKVTTPRPGDFHFTPAGMVVTSGTYGLCDSHRHADPATGLSRCGCDRCFTGIGADGRSTTTAEVAECEVTREGLIKELTDTLAKMWDAPESEVAETAQAEVDEMLTIAGRYSVGAQLGINIEDFFVR